MIIRRYGYLLEVDIAYQALKLPQLKNVAASFVNLLHYLVLIITTGVSFPLSKKLIKQVIFWLSL